MTHHAKPHTIWLYDHTANGVTKVHLSPAETKEVLDALRAACAAVNYDDDEDWDGKQEVNANAWGLADWFNRCS